MLFLISYSSHAPRQSRGCLLSANGPSVSLGLGVAAHPSDTTPRLSERKLLPPASGMLATGLVPGPGCARAIHTEALGEMPPLVRPSGAPMRRLARVGPWRGPLVRRGPLLADHPRTGAMVLALPWVVRGIDELVTARAIARRAVAPVGVVPLAAGLEAVVATQGLTPGGVDPAPAAIDTAALGAELILVPAALGLRGPPRGGGDRRAGLPAAAPTAPVGVGTGWSLWEGWLVLWFRSCRALTPAWFGSRPEGDPAGYPPGPGPRERARAAPDRGRRLGVLPGQFVPVAMVRRSARVHGRHAPSLEESISHRRQSWENQCNLPAEIV